MSITENARRVVRFRFPITPPKRAIFHQGRLADHSVNSWGRNGWCHLGETHEQVGREQGYTVKTYKGLP